MKLAALPVAITVLSLAQPAGLRPDPPINCGDCAGWNADVAPSRLFGNTYTVGTAGLSSLLITSPAGHVLMDGALPQSAGHIDRHIRALGFRTEDVTLILVSHGHYDHAGGVAALQRFTAARVAASPSTAAALRAGVNTPDDPQAGFGTTANRFPSVATVQELKDGETVRVGDIDIRVHHIPGHAPGSTAYTWRSCEGAVCKDLVYADSLTAVSAPGFRFSGDATHPSLVAAFRRSIATVAALPCDILVAPHPFSAAGKTCRTYAADASERLDARLAEEARSR
ncbi:MAG: subclass B3 metallo-beta-lactamase [Acidobacteriota bacterium]|nr:subclass B3 metallo-beta-lactamase [Acidobacteriota bacterium]